MAIRLLSLDFDGTLVSDRDDPPVHPDLVGALRDLQAAGIPWAVNTGRTLGHLQAGLDYLGPGLAPDFVLTRERDVFRRNGGGWVPCGDWNRRCEEAHVQLNRDARPLFRRLEEFLEVELEAELIYEFGCPAGVITRDEQDMERLVGFLAELQRELPALSYQRNTVFLRFCHADYHKGSALSELARVLEIPAEAIFVAGDDYNDLPMLDRRHAGFIACPANAVDRVKETVRAAGGYIAAEPCSRGVFEAICHFRNGNGHARPA